MKRLREAAAAYATELAMAAGAVRVCVGVGLYSAPAGLIAAGVFLLAGAVLSALGGGGDQ